LSGLALGALPSAVPCARLHVRAILKEWNLAHLANDAELIVSEITTNAVRACARLNSAALPVIRLWVTCNQASVTIHVWDASPGTPARQDASPDAESGRGLLLVETLAAEWAVDRDQAGKTVWARVSQ
jgi:anti-sigma regulatory factor (Ser/Thr protein kinase)